MATVQSEVYKAISGICEELEKTGNYIGNGHHLAQRLAKVVEDKARLIVRPKKGTIQPVPIVGRTAPVFAEPFKTPDNRPSPGIVQG
jgi:hypothetical protein